MIKYSNAIIFLSLALILATACEQAPELSPSTNLADEVSRAKQWYENSFDNSFGSKPRTTVVGHTNQAKQPVWERAIVSERNGKTYIDVPLQYYRIDNVTQNTSSDVVNTTDGAKVHRSALIALEEEYTLVVLNIIPEEDFDMPEEGYGYLSLLEQGFDGKMIYSDFSGNLRGGHIFENGVATSKIKLFKRTPNVNLDIVRSGINNGGNVDQGGCVIQVMTLYERYCDYDASGWEECTEWQPIGTYTWYECQMDYLDDDDWGSGDGPPMEDPISEIKNSVTDPCLKEKIDNAIQDTLTNNLMDSLENAMGLIGGGEFELEILTDNSYAGTTTDGETENRNAFLIEIYINPDLTSSSQEYVTATLYHEFLHATFLFYEMVRDRHVPSFSNEYLQLFDSLIANGMNPKDVQHHIMLNNYMTDFRNAVLEVHPNLTTNELEALTLHGLQALTPTQHITNNNHRVGSQGTNCN